jgi:peroxiredoxin Q/BCP
MLTQGANKMPALGDSAPDFELRTDEGSTIKLSDYRGKKVILYFYPHDFTSGCELQACSFRDAYPLITAKNAVVLGISGDTVDSHQRFRSTLQLPFNLLADEDFAVSKAWGNYGPRTWSDGSTHVEILRGHYVIDEAGKIIDIQNPVKATESKNLAVAKL